MAEFNEIYRRAVYYDIVFNRDVSSEIEFIITVYQRFHWGQSPSSLIDLACGPGYHARNFASRGLRAVGLDLREEMLAFAAEAAQREGVDVQWVAADMRHLQLDAPVDVAINVFDGIDCLLTNDDLIAHMDAIAANLTPNGLYFVDVTSPCMTTFSHYAQFCYRGKRDGISVELRWKGDPGRIDVLTGVANTEVEMIVDDHGHDYQFKDIANERLLTAQEIILLARCSGKMAPVGWFGAYDVDQPFDNSPEASRMIAVLQKL